MRRRPGSVARAAVLVAVAAAASACQSPTAVEPDPAVAPFVGTWDARSVVLTSVADPETSFDLIEEGGEFTLIVEPSGYYQAHLQFLGQPDVESGQMTVSGNVVTIDPNQADRPTTSGTFEFHGPDAFTLQGETEFDFNLDGEDEKALVTFEFVRA